MNPAIPQKHFLVFPIIGSSLSKVEFHRYEFVAHFCILLLIKYRLYSRLVLKEQEACQLEPRLKNTKKNGSGISWRKIKKRAPSGDEEARLPCPNYYFLFQNGS
jgi:hypothetical protein